MHKYMFHIGDFNSATLHLSKQERWFYRDLIDIYYDYEKPIRDDFNWICRKLRAETEQEATAVEQVLTEFFKYTDIGWTHDICDEVLAEYHDNQEKKSKAGKASAEARAKKAKASKANPTPVEQGSTAAANQKPETRNHSKDIADLLNYLNSISGRRFREAGSLKQRLQEGFTVQDVKLVLDYKVAEWTGTENAKYIRPDTLFRKSKFEGYLNDAKTRVPTTNPGHSQQRPSSAEQVSAAIQNEIARQETDSSDLAGDGR